MGRVTLIFIAFQRQAQAMIDSWAISFDAAFGSDSRVLVYEIPMISGWTGRLMGGMIDAGMRSGIPAQRHPFVVTFYGKFQEYQDILEMDDLSSAYLFLLDRRGIIRWRKRGFSDVKSRDDLLDVTRSLLEEEVEQGTDPEDI